MNYLNVKSQQDKKKLMFRVFTQIPAKNVTLKAFPLIVQPPPRPLCQKKKGAISVSYNASAATQERTPFSLHLLPSVNFE